MNKVRIKELNFEQLQAFMKELGQPTFRAKQVWQWIWVKGAQSWEEMTNLSKDLRGKLSEGAILENLEITTCQVSAKDGTRKYLFKLPDGHYIESVLMSHGYGNSVCVSTQVGCKMGCGFCASTLGGLVRNLKTWEIYDQVMRIQQDIGERVSSIVLMGSGEPLDNYEASVEFIKLISSEEGLHIGQRHITLSTCGLVPEIYRLAEEQLSITLSISLHAPSDEQRRVMMPINQKYKIDELLKACDTYVEKTGRRITYEYSLVAGVNDDENSAHKLAQLLKGKLAHINLIPVNPVLERGYKKPREDKIKGFQKVLEKYKIEATVRKEMGADIDAACGQLRRRYEEELKLNGGVS